MEKRHRGQLELQPVGSFQPKPVTFTATNTTDSSTFCSDLARTSHQFHLSAANRLTAMHANNEASSFTSSQFKFFILNSFITCSKFPNISRFSVDTLN